MFYYTAIFQNKNISSASGRAFPSPKFVGHYCLTRSKKTIFVHIYRPMLRAMLGGNWMHLCD